MVKLALSRGAWYGPVKTKRSLQGGLMRELMDWEDGRRTPHHPPQPASTAHHPPAPPTPGSAPSLDLAIGTTVTFRNVMEERECQGTIVNIAHAAARDHARLGHLPARTLYLVTYDNEKPEGGLAVIWNELIVTPKKPRS